MIKNNHIYIINSLEDFEDFQKKSKYKWSFSVKYVNIKEEVLKNNSILVKDSSNKHELFYYDIGDYLSRSQKLQTINKLRPMVNIN